MKRLLHGVLGLTLVCVLSVFLGCSCDSNSEAPSDEPSQAVEPTESASPTEATPPATQEQAVLLYFVREVYVGVAGREVLVSSTDTGTLAASAVQELLKGPNAEETEWGLSTQIPDGTTLNGVEIADGVATVDLSQNFESGGGSLSMSLRVAQVVYTLTQFGGIESVAFKLDGTSVQAIGGEGIMVDPPVTRADFEDQTPAILVEEPVPGQTVTSPLVIKGTANVFEAQFAVEIVDPEGLVVTTKSIMATSGTGTRGTFAASIAFEPTRSGLGSIVFWEPSAKDGSRTNIVEIPVYMTK